MSNFAPNSKHNRRLKLESLLEKAEEQGKGDEFVLRCAEFNPVMEDFMRFYAEHKELRFWQAIRAWSGAEAVFVGSKGEVLEWEEFKDTFYWNGKTE